MGNQNEAKNLLSTYLSQIGDEQVTICIDGVPQQVTRAEALARKMYLLALGGFEEVITPDGKQTVYHKPDYKVARMIREFTEGKPNQEPAVTKTKGKRAGNFNSKITKRLNESVPVINKPCTRPAIRPIKKEGE